MIRIEAEYSLRSSDKFDLTYSLIHTCCVSVYSLIIWSWLICVIVNWLPEKVTNVTYKQKKNKLDKIIRKAVDNYPSFLGTPVEIFTVDNPYTNKSWGICWWWYIATKHQKPLRLRNCIMLHHVDSVPLSFFDQDHDVASKRYKYIYRIERSIHIYISIYDVMCLLIVSHQQKFHMDREI